MFGVNLALLAAVAAWLFLDPKLTALVMVGPAPNWSQWTWQECVFTILLGFAAASFGVMGLSFIFGGKDCRRPKTMLAIATLLGCWLGLAVNSSEFNWQGKRWRLRNLGATLDPVVADLTKRWPGDDGERPVLGPFMAYPIGKPTTLLLLKPPQVSDNGILINAVERVHDGAIKFGLAGREPGDWLEWHPTASQPASHVGGLVEPFELKRLTKISEHWYLVRYKSWQPARPAPPAKQSESAPLSAE